MLMRSLSCRRTARFLALSIIVAGLIIGSPVFVAPTISCPGPPPQPLRELYLRSASIVIARVGESEITKETNPDGDEIESETFHLKTALLVSSTLKGDHQPVVYVSHYKFREYKDQLSSAAPDENLLVFLDKVEGVEGYYVDMSYGLKKLTDADLKVYVSRIEELASIMKAGKPADTEIVEWLVRCAEEPATRWEGAYELAMSHNMAQDEADEAAQPVEVEVLEGQTAEPAVENENAVEIEEMGGRFGSVAPTQANFAKLLTTEQKYRLTTALINSDAVAERDYYLLDIVKRWDDPRLVPYLLAQLDLVSRPDRSEEMDSYFTDILMTIVADKLGDDALKAVVRRLNGSEDEQAEIFEDEQSDVVEQAPARSPEQEAAEEAAAVHGRSAELQHFITLAMSSVPKAPTTEPAIPEITAEP